jgi:hypothetical protein
VSIRIGIIFLGILLACSCIDPKPISEKDAVTIATKAVAERYPRIKVNRSQAQPWPIKNAWMVRYLPKDQRIMITVLIRKSNGEVLVVYLR